MQYFRFQSLRAISALIVVCMICATRVFIDIWIFSSDDVTLTSDTTTLITTTAATTTTLYNDVTTTTVLNDVIMCGSQQPSTRLEREFTVATRLCLTTRRPAANRLRTNSTWQRHTDTFSNTFVLYSAFYDDRPATGVVPWIRIQGVASLTNRTNTSVYCHVWFNHCLAPYVTEAVAKITGRDYGYVIDKVRYVQYMFSCRLPGTDPIPSHVSLVATDQCSTSSIFLPVERPIRSEPDHEFGVCVAIAFGHIAPAEFVEWIELNRMFGITEFNIYDAGMVNMSTVFEYYIKQGVLRVNYMPPPVPERPKPAKTNNSENSSVTTDQNPYTVYSAKLGSTTSLNDCQLRNVYRYRYVVVIDFDEIIVPRFHSNYSQMIQHIEHKYKLRDPPFQYLFVNTYFFLEFQPDMTQPSHLRTARFRQRAAPSADGFAPKTFVDPRLCLIAYNHYCLRPLYGSPPMRLTDVHVNPGIARSHHYRHCTYGNKTCSTYYSTQTRDDQALTFKDKLQPLVERVLSNLGIRTT